MARIMAPVVFFGYPVPDCCANSDDAERFFCEDLDRMGKDDLVRELHALRHVIHNGKLFCVTRPPIVNTPDGRPKSFYVWARDRMRRIEHALNRAEV